MTGRVPTGCKLTDAPAPRTRRTLRVMATTTTTDNQRIDGRRLAADLLARECSERDLQARLRDAVGEEQGVILEALATVRREGSA